MRFKMWTIRKLWYLTLMVSIIFSAIYFELLQKVTCISSLVDRNSCRFSQIKNDICHLPKLDPYDSSILKYLYDPDPINCSDRDYSPIFYTDMDSNLLFNVTYETLVNVTDCCYRDITRGDNKDDDFRLSIECYQVEGRITKIQKSSDYIAVYCNNSITSARTLIDMFGFIHLKESVEERLANISKLTEHGIDESVNVVILGLDGISHMNFIRTMPKTNSFLKNNLSAVSMNGFTKVGDNTYPNVYPLLMGLSNKAVVWGCALTNTFDSCPIIWNLYSSLGYRTVHYEDGHKHGTLFNTHHGNDFIKVTKVFNTVHIGFTKPPTDYYLRPLFIAQDELLGHYRLSGHYQACFGPRLGFEYMLDYFKKAAYTFGKNNKKYFQFVWSNVLSHDFLNLPKLGDEHVFNLLEFLNSGNYLNKTVFILISDHGMNAGEMRANTYQGSIENKMPFMYSVFPKWVLKKYKLAFDNFRLNSERLVTHFDIHETLKDLANLENIQTENIRKRSNELETFDFFSPFNWNAHRGISLFLPIPKHRTCDQAAIPNQYCICHSLNEVNIQNSSKVTSFGEIVVQAINGILSKSSECALLTLLNITRLQKSAQEENEGSHLALVNLVTTPGNASFEATLVKGGSSQSWTVDDPTTISRTNTYGNQSHCVSSNDDLKRFCYCKSNIME